MSKRNHWIRQAHRWLSIVFTLAVIANIAMMFRPNPPMWIGFLALVPLIPMLITGLYMFAQPYLARGRSAQPHHGDTQPTERPAT